MLVLQVLAELVLLDRRRTHRAVDRRRHVDGVRAAVLVEPSLDTWWGRAVQPGLAALAEEELVERPTTKTYRIESEEEG